MILAKVVYLTADLTAVNIKVVFHFYYFLCLNLQYILLFKFDFGILCKEFNLHEYDILIFNPKFNYVNKYNKNINGIMYNGMINDNYMLRHKSRRSLFVNILSSKLVFFIFSLIF